ncbi:putative ATP-dependent RNA helicase TDRD12, partial [Notothenia coriiceps]|uniref:RNA helicase n=1 Tax=Notothenia coriiceps TaxID=8208 RepID=A0A6I9NZ24_9TELE
VCVVYWAVIKSWSRVLVESIITDSVSCQARCLLVDHGERLVVPSDQIRIAMLNFLQLPFWVRKFHLARIKPTTLRVCVHEIKAGLM